MKTVKHYIKTMLLLLVMSPVVMLAQTTTTSVHNLQSGDTLYLDKYLAIEFSSISHWNYDSIQNASYYPEFGHYFTTSNDGTYSIIVNDSMNTNQHIFTITVTNTKVDTNAMTNSFKCVVGSMINLAGKLSLSEISSWVISNPYIGQISQNGDYTAVDTGNVIVTATSYSLKKTVSFIITNYNYGSVILLKKITVTIGDTIELVSYIPNGVALFDGNITNGIVINNLPVSLKYVSQNLGIENITLVDSSIKYVLPIQTTLANTVTTINVPLTLKVGEQVDLMKYIAGNQNNLNWSSGNDSLGTYIFTAIIASSTTNIIATSKDGLFSYNFKITTLPKSIDTTSSQTDTIHTTDTYAVTVGVPVNLSKLIASNYKFDFSTLNSSLGIVTTTDSSNIWYTALAVGINVFTATDNYWKIVAKINLVANTDTATVQDPILIQDSLYIEEGKQVEIKSYFSDLNFDSTIQWTSSSDSIIGLNNGYVWGIAKGNSKISAYSADKKKVYWIYISVESATKPIQIVKPTITNVTLIDSITVQIEFAEALSVDDVKILLDILYNSNAPTHLKSDIILNATILSVTVDKTNPKIVTVTVKDALPSSFIINYSGTALETANGDKLQAFSYQAKATTKVNEVQVKATLYPNPVINNATITSSDANISTISIFDISGSIVKSLQNVNASSTTIDVSSLLTGVYLMKIFDENENVSIILFLK